jgi:hypothetical protein
MENPNTETASLFYDIITFAYRDINHKMII